jgi:hypothetical protein
MAILVLPKCAKAPDMADLDVALGKIMKGEGGTNGILSLMA